jgi:hypothetical protein
MRPKQNGLSKLGIQIQFGKNAVQQPADVLDRRRCGRGSAAALA